MATEEVIEVEVFFVNGLSTILIQDRERFEKFKIALKDNWHKGLMTEEYFGINFSLVTHYKKIKG